ncbi:LOW QUALITY PROTEIN: T-cell immunomodulatory protein [Lepeophtheirus salmonis]|uniref:LOW QUALITY PROTEIN: T-cell immunomodulatory protein n=1 Tax=Lepeophtheirus salmonis TaxID=72036 RepID=UPI003AF38528
MKNVILVLYFMWILFPHLCIGQLLQNVTSKILGSLPRSMIPLAFGDFNADKLTDVFVTDSEERSKIAILFAIPQTLASSPSSPYFDVKKLRDKKRVCHFNRGVIQGASLGDFDGDGCLDVNVRFQDRSLVLWGDRDPEDGSHALICSDEARSNGWNFTVFSDIHPLVMDENEDYVADIFTAINKNQPGFFIYSSDRKYSPTWKPLSEDPSLKIHFRSPHSNAYVDLNNDGNADLFLTTKSGFEIWLRDKSGSFKKEREIPMDNYQYIGQASFADFNLDGSLDIIVPVCYDKECLNGTILMGPLSKLTRIGKTTLSPALQQEDFGQWKLDIISEEEDVPYFELTARVGDVNLDGYPDVLIRLKHKVLGYTRTNLLLNSEAKPNLLGAIDKNIDDNKKTKFHFSTEYTRGANDTIMAAFFDFFEDGSLDLFTVSRKAKDLEFGAFTNMTQNSDAYFIKVIVLTGVKPPCSSYDCKGEPVPYGTSFSGQSVCYKSHRPDIDQSVIFVESCSSQLTQTAHNALQLPYTIFGLGLSPNFIDYMSVSVTNSTLGSQNHTWPQIIPNSQLYVIPYPPNEPYEWLLKLYVTPSRSITLTGLALVGTCGLVALIIGILHWRDRRADYKERREESHRFHFDAM